MAQRVRTVTVGAQRLRQGVRTTKLGSSLGLGLRL